MSLLNSVLGNDSGFPIGKDYATIFNSEYENNIYKLYENLSASEIAKRYFSLKQKQDEADEKLLLLLEE